MGARMPYFSNFTRMLLGVTAGAMLAGGAMAQEVTLRFHQFLPSTAPVPAEILIPWMEKVTAESDGRIAFEHYPSMQLGGTPPELVDQVIDGVVDIIYTLPGYSPGRFPRTEVIELPFLMTDPLAASMTLSTLGEKYMFDTEYADMKILGMWVHGPGLIHSETPITTPDDLSGVKLRAPTRVANIMATQLGATTVGMPVPGVPESLSKGVISAALLPWEVTASLKTSELVDNHTEFPGAPLYTAAFIMAMNIDSYNALPDDLKAVIDANSGLAFAEFAGTIAPGLDGPGRQMAVDLGNNIISLTPDQIAIWKEAAAPTIDRWIAEMDEKGIDGRALYDEAVALMEQFTDK